MNRQQALNQLRLMQAWHEDFGNGPCPDYDAICYAINIIEAQPKELDTLIKALEAEHKKLLEMQKALKNVPDTNVGDTISRQAAIDVLDAYQVKIENGEENPYAWARMRMSELPSTQFDTDCISRKAAITQLSHNRNKCDEEWELAVDNDIQTIWKLPPAQPEQTNCDYCHEDVDGYVKPIEKNGHAFVRFGMNGWELELKAKGWHGEAKIQYCPMCGRKL